MSGPTIDLDKLYDVVALIARTGDTITYQGVTDAYKDRTNVFVHRKDWGQALGELNQRCDAVGLPAISTVVTDDGAKGTPGSRYWGNPGAPSYGDYNLWLSALAQVHAAIWPSKLPKIP